jgi:hypothetical protein
MDSLRDMRLVEKAAKAAGYGVGRWSDDGRGLLLVGVQEPWNPLEDDGDALRLAVKLGISLQFSGKRYSVSRRQVWDICCLWEGDDKCALIRRQIVEEAAASADSKPPNARVQPP